MNTDLRKRKLLSIFPARQVEAPCPLFSRTTRRQPCGQVPSAILWSQVRVAASR
jgi:hypothetical protein